MGGAPWFDGAPITVSVEPARALASPYIRSGRAVMLVVLKGFSGRPWPANYRAPDPSSVKFRELTVQRVTDMRRAVDYLQTRADIDSKKIAFWGVSADQLFVVHSANEDRYRAGILLGTGIHAGWHEFVREANPLAFAPHIDFPKLVLNGAFDETHPPRATVQPLLNLMRHPKRLELHEGGHLPSTEVAVPIINGWLDEWMGPIQRPGAPSTVPTARLR
jgi:dienelactone hydrolase